jgi:membrane protein YqaA with SNARE-associated domain
VRLDKHSWTACFLWAAKPARPSTHNLLPQNFAWRSVWRWLIHLGGPGLILLGIADNSLVPLPGSMDLLTILLSSRQHTWWLYYAGMATAGAVLGGYLTYRLARRGGKEALDKRLSKKRAQWAMQTFEHRGFWAVAVPAMLPPPVPIVPFLLVAGAVQYPRQKFLAALALGRAVRFTIIAFVASHYGRHIFRFFAKYYQPALYLLIGIAIGAGIVLLVVYLRHRQASEVRKGGADEA